MLYKDFKKIIELIQDCHKIQDKSSDFITSATWNKHNELIISLLIQIYNEAAVEYILNEWLLGHRNPVTFEHPKTHIVEELPLETEKDLWHVMERFKNEKVRVPV